MNERVVRPVITEKTLNLASRGWFTFYAGKTVRKEQISDVIETLYKVNVTNIRTVAMHGKQRRVGKRAKPQLQADWKKALVRLKTGQRIEAFDISSESQKGQTA